MKNQYNLFTVIAVPSREASVREHIGAIIGGVIGVLAAVGVVGVVLFILYKRYFVPS